MGTETDSADGMSDRVTDALLTGTVYERLRYERFSHFKQHIHEKLTWQAYLFCALGLVFPLSLLVPESLYTVFSGNPIHQRSVILVLGCIAFGIEFGTAVGHSVVGWWKIRLYGEMTEQQAESLLALEDVSSLLAFVTGLGATAVFVFVYLLAVVGEGQVKAALETVFVSNPYREVASVPVTGMEFAVVSVGAAVVTYTVAAYFRVVEMRVVRPPTTS